MDAASPEEVGIWLSDRQYHVLNVAAGVFAPEVSPVFRRFQLSAREMNYFLVQLSSLINAGCPLVQSLGALQRQSPPGSLKTLLIELKDKIEMGKSFSDALKAYPDVFSNLFITMVEVGEIGGILDQVMEKYAQIYDSLYRIRAKIIKSMIYPAMLMVLTITVAWALLVWVFPVFMEQIGSRGGVLPLPTRIVLALSQFLGTVSDFIFFPVHALPMARIAVYPIYFFGILGLFYVLLARFLAIPEVRRFVDTVLIKVPLLGNLIRQTELTLFSRTLGTLIKCGVPILTSLAAVEKAMNNFVFKNALNEIRTGVARGESLSKGMVRRRDLFPESMILMADVGERGGNVGDLMTKAADFYERDMETTIDAVVSLIEPALVIFLAVFVVILALAMYMPLFDIIKMVR